jgi:hypothetical protein
MSSGADSAREGVASFAAGSASPPQPSRTVTATASATVESEA